MFFVLGDLWGLFGFKLFYDLEGKSDMFIEDVIVGSVYLFRFFFIEGIKELEFFFMIGGEFEGFLVFKGWGMFKKILFLLEFKLCLGDWSCL